MGHQCAWMQLVLLHLYFTLMYMSKPRGPGYTFGNLIEKSILLIGTVICNYLQENSNQVILLDLECRLIYMHFRFLCATSQQFYEIKNFLKNEMFYAFAMVLAAAIAWVQENFALTKDKLLPVLFTPLKPVGTI